MLKLYKKAYNLDGGLHKLFYDFDDYMTFMGTPYMQFDLSDYRINQNEIRVTTSANETDVDEILYAIDDRRNPLGDGYYRCYIVNFGVVQSGYIIFQVAVDWWASYIARISTAKLHVTRCNRNIGNGLYDAITAVGENSSYMFTSTPLTTDKLSIVYVVNGSTGNSTFISGAGSFTRMYYNTLQNLSSLSGTAALNEVIDKVQGIFGISGGLQIDAQPIKAYIIPTAWLVAGILTPAISFVSQTNSSGTVAVTPQGSLKPHVYSLSATGTIDPDYEHYFGTRLNGLKLTRVTGTTNAEIVCVFNADGIQVIVKEGGNMLDITSSFSVGLTTNSANSTNLEKIQSSINMLGSIAGSTEQLASGKYVSGASGLAKTAAGVFVPNNVHYVGGGDAYATFAEGDNLYYPIRTMTSKSIDDENEKAKRRGATFDEYTYLSTLTENSYLGSDISFNHTYVQGDEFLIEDIPAQAAAEIKRRLREGIYFDEIVGE